MAFRNPLLTRLVLPDNITSTKTGEGWTMACLGSSHQLHLLSSTDIGTHTCPWMNTDSEHLYIHDLNAGSTETARRPFIVDETERRRGYEVCAVSTYHVTPTHHFSPNISHWKELWRHHSNYYWQDLCGWGVESQESPTTDLLFESPTQSGPFRAKMRSADGGWWRGREFHIIAQDLISFLCTERLSIHFELSGIS